MEPRYQLKLDGITCAMCTDSVMQILSKPENKIHGLIDHSISLETKMLTLRFSSAEAVPKDLQQKLEDLLDAYDPKDLIKILETVPAPPSDAGAATTHLRKGLLGLFMGLGFVLMMVFGWHIPYIVMASLIALGVLTSLYLGYKSSKIALRKLFNTGSLTMDLLFMVSATAAIVMTIGHLFIPGIPMMVDVALLIFAFRHIGLAIEHRIRQKIADRLHFEDCLSSHYDVVDDEGNTSSTPREDLKPEMVIRLRAGQMLPFDGNSKTRGCLDASNITGATRFIVGENQPLRSGVFLHADDQPIDIILKQGRDRSFIYQYDQLLNSNKQSQALIEQRADKIMRYFLPMVVIIAITAALITAFYLPWLTSLRTGLYILVSACPCIFGMITPLALYVGMMKSSTQGGVTFDSRVSFEKAGKVNAVVFDISGTLTENKLTLKGCTVPDEHLPLIAWLEQDANHIVGAFIHQYAVDKATSMVKYDKKFINHDDSRGVSAEFNDHTYLIGSSDFIKAKGYSKLIPATSSPRTYFVKDDIVIGVFDIEDPLRHDANETINSLKSMGVDIYLCTGMSSDAASYYSNKLGVEQDHVFSGCLPSDKVNHMINLTKTKVTLFAGDGGNDKGALQNAYLGIAVTSNTLVQQEAGAILNDVSNLKAIPAALMYAKRTMRHINHNVLFSLSYNLASLVFVCVAVIYFPQFLNPAMGAAIMFIQTVMVLGNTLKFKLSDAGGDAGAMVGANNSAQKGYDFSIQRDSPEQKKQHYFQYGNDKSQSVTSLAIKPISLFNISLK